MSKMSAPVLKSYEEQSFHKQEVDIPVPGAGEVLIKVHASG